MEGNIIQLKEYHLNKGASKDHTPVFPRTKVSAIEGMSEFLKDLKINGVTPTSDISNIDVPEKGKIYYEESTDKYYVYSEDKSSFVELGADIYTKDEVDGLIDDKLTEVTVNAVGNSATMYFAGSALCIASANLIQVTATPTITYVDNEQNVVVSISGNGTLKAYLDGVEQTLVNGSFTIAKTSVAQNVVVTATAKEDGKAISAEAELTIEVGAYIDRSKMLTGFGTNSTDFPIYLDGSSEPSFTAVVDAEHPFTKYGETMYNWSVDFSEEETQPTGLYNAANRNIFVNANSVSNASVYGITHIPDSVTTLKNTFQNCTSLKEVELGNVATLDMAFRNTALAGSVDFSNSMLQYADNQAFRDCGGITSIKFPSMFMRLGGNTMSSCSNLTSMTFLGNTAPTITASSTANNALNYCSALAHIYVPIGTRSAYVTAFTSALGYLEKSTDIIEEISE